MKHLVLRTTFLGLSALAIGGLGGCESESNNVGPSGVSSSTSTSTTTTQQCPASQSYAPAPNFHEPVGGMTRKGHYHGFAAGCYTECFVNEAVCAPGTRCVQALLPHRATGTGDDMGITAHKICVAKSKGNECAGLEVGTYKNAVLKECMDEKGAKTQCHWTIEILDDTRFRWTRGGPVQDGEYVCHDGKVFVNVPMDLTDFSRSAVFDLSKKSITWEKEVYQKSPTPK